MASRSPIPWLHIAEVVAKTAAHRGYRHAALLGTRLTMNGPVYPEMFRKHSVKIISPDEQDQKVVDDIIFHELVKGRLTEPSRLAYDQVIRRMQDRGCDCVVLGCTEIPLLVRAEDCPLPTLDSTRLLAAAAVDAVLAMNSGR